jgi:hypothetical protein
MTQRDCQRVRADLVELAQGKLEGEAEKTKASEGERLARARAHVAHCAGCAAELIALEQVIRGLSTLPALPIPASLAELPPLPVRTPPRLFTAPRLAVAAAILITTALGTSVWLASRPQPKLHLIVIDDATPVPTEVWDSIEDFSGLDGEWLAGR